MNDTKPTTDETIRAFQPGVNVQHRNPDLTNWRGTVTPKPPKARSRWGQTGQHILFNDNYDADVWVQWQTSGEVVPSPSAGWCSTEMLDIVS